MGIRKVDAIKAFLMDSCLGTHLDLAELYNEEMQCTVYVSRSGGDRVEGSMVIESPLSSSNNEINWVGYTDGITVWKNFCIPWKSGEYDIDGSMMSFSLAEKALGIGLSGWNWKRKKSVYVGFDFDSIIGHTKGLTDKELQEIIDKVSQVDWVTVRKSTSGKGLHLYVFFDNSRYVNDIVNPSEHAAVARSVLNLLSGCTGFDFNGKVDKMGGNLWIWHRKMFLGEEKIGLQLLKKGRELSWKEIGNWKDYVPVVRGISSRARLEPIVLQGEEVVVNFEDLLAKKVKVPLESSHLSLINWLRERGYYAEWRSDDWMLITHTFFLKEGHSLLALRGWFDTLATGSGGLDDKNCFSGETEVLTKDGIFKIKDLAKKGYAELWVYDWGMKKFRWMNCPIKSFGIQKTFPIKFVNGDIVWSTANHRWPCHRTKNIEELEKYDWKYTSAINFNKDMLYYAKFELPNVDWEGYAHGFIFGDGNEYKTRNNETLCEVSLFKNDVDLKDLLCNYGTLGYRYNKGHGYLDHIRNLPGNWKRLPKNPSNSYKLGFILGLISADGYICGAHLTINQSDRGTLEIIKKWSLEIGLRAFNLRRVWSQKGFDNAKPNYNLSISCNNLTKNHFLRKDQQDKLKIGGRKTTSIKNVDWDISREEEVFCAEVRLHENFTLGNHVVTSNCYCFPLPGGAWIIRRYNPGCREIDGWFIDGAGWTCCYYNRLCDVRTAARVHQGNEHSNGSFVFSTVEAAMQAVGMLGGDLGEVPNWILGKECTLKEHPTDLGRLVIEIKKNEADGMEGMGKWIASRGKWSRIVDVRRVIGGVGGEKNNYDGRHDDKIRHLVTESGGDAGWVIKSDGLWRDEPLWHVKPALKSLGYLSKEIDVIIGGCIFRPWKIVHRPFEKVEENGREWNRKAPQYRWSKIDNSEAINYKIDCKHWKKILEHIGKGLDEGVKSNKWCASVGIMDGEDYLKYWIASLLKEPTRPLPYLFLYGPQGSGKSILHEAIDLLITGGIVRADNALLSSGGFNAELEGSVLCVVEEVDLKINKNAYNRLKDWVTSLKLSIHKKGLTPYMVTNTTHWIQTSNDPSSVPLLPGDRRIVMCYVEGLAEGERIAEKVLLRELEKEAQAFLTHLLMIEMEESEDSLNLPAITTDSKVMAESHGKNAFEMFLEEEYYYCPGVMVTIAQLYEEFLAWLEPSERGNWSKIKMGKCLPMQYIKGRRSTDSAWCIGNIMKKGDLINNNSNKGRKLILKGEMLT